MFRIRPIHAVLLIFLFAGGCETWNAGTARQVIANGAKTELKAGVKVTTAELEQINRAFADRYVVQYAAACDAIEKDNPDPQQRRLAHDLKTSSASAVYDIVTNGDPYTQVLDLTVAVTLQSIVFIDEDQAEEQFGPKGVELIRASRATRLDIWDIASKLFTTQELENLDYLIWDWRRHNLAVTNVVGVRFSDFIPTAGGTGDSRTQGIFAQIDEARHSVDEARLFAERAVYLAKRMPLLIAWRTETSVQDVAADPEIVQALADFHTLADVANKLPGTIDGQRAKLESDFDQRQPALDQSIKNIRETLAQADTVAASITAMLAQLQKSSAALQDLVKQTDTTVSKYMPPPTPPPASPTADSDHVSKSAGQPGAATQAISPSAAASAPPARPFDVHDYTDALTQLTAASRELNTVLSSTRDLLDSPAWTHRIDEINTAADGRVRIATAQSQSLVNSIFRRVYLAMGAFFLLLVLYRVFASTFVHRLHSRKEHPR